ncbi:MAG TPA: class I SAM-dependent methyltransferase [Dongiaceae bacterium]|jgi:ubiquinone/menaquinone biosynthesis C-methylase UbiE|nr:class I SAM-dependent methyltransferase [Dongiaceae bacterium]
MSFDRLAPYYRGMEAVLAGGIMQECRTAFLHAIPAPQNVLLLGEGNGRCLLELLRGYPTARFTCVDASARMLDCARERLRRHGLNPEQVEFVQANILEWSPPPATFDLLVTHFFLDCFRPDQLTEIVPRLAAAAAPGARWLLADFCEPAAGPAKWRARAILASLYLFFRQTTRLPASHLTPPDPYLSARGFVLRARRKFDWGLLHSDLWTHC